MSEVKTKAREQHVGTQQYSIGRITMQMQRCSKPVHCVISDISLKTTVAGEFEHVPATNKSSDSCNAMTTCILCESLKTIAALHDF
jgi:hypothetical protein